MSLDLIIRDAQVIDGSGARRFGADVGIAAGKIAAIGKVNESAKEVIDAQGAVVSPGFIDGHTHMDAQVFWDSLGTCSCWHGITSVVMGNCGFTLAPCRESEKHLVMRNLERAEDISPAAMEAGIRWSWEDFPQYLDAVERLPKGINYAAYMGHSALRTYIMGERAFSEQANGDDLAAMKREVRKAIRAGAIGFTSSRSFSHQTPQGQPVASRLASWDEVRQLVGVMGELGAGVFELANEDMRDHDAHPRIPRAPQESRGGYRRAGYIWRVLGQGAARGLLEDGAGEYRRDRGGGRADVRAGAYAVVECIVRLPDGDAL